MSALTSQSSTIPQNFTNQPGYSQAVHLKPKITYIDLIREAILSFPGNPSLQEIYNYIQKTYPFYHPKDDGWKNSVRHTLSLSPLFKNIPRVYPQPGKGGLWRINPDAPAPTSKRKDKSSKGPALSGKSSRSPYSPGGKKRSSGANSTSQPTKTHPLNPALTTTTATDLDSSNGKLYAAPSGGNRDGPTYASSSSSTTLTDGYTPLSNNLYGIGPQLSPVSPHDQQFRPPYHHQQPHHHQQHQQQHQQQQQPPSILQRSQSSWSAPPYSAPLSTYTDPSYVSARPALNPRQTYPAPNQFSSFSSPTAQFGHHAGLSGSSSLATPASILDVSSGSNSSTLSTNRSPNQSDHSESQSYPTPGYDSRSFDQHSPHYDSSRHLNTTSTATAQPVVYRPQLSYAFPTQQTQRTNHPSGGPSSSDHHQQQQQQQQAYYQPSVASQQQSNQPNRYIYSDPAHQQTPTLTDPRSTPSTTADPWKPSQRSSPNAHQGLPSFSTLLPIPGASLSSSSAQAVPSVPLPPSSNPLESAQSSAYNHQYQRPNGNDIHSADGRGRPFVSHAAHQQQRQSPPQLSHHQQQYSHPTDSYFPSQLPGQPFQSFQSYPIQNSLAQQSSN